MYIAVSKWFYVSLQVKYVKGCKTPVEDGVQPV